MARFRRKPVPVEAVQLRWDTWSEMCELTKGSSFEGCYVDADGRITDDSNARMGLKVTSPNGKLIAVQDDWVVRTPDGELTVLRPERFATIYESHADYETQYEPDWSKYPKLAKVFEHRPPENVYWDDLRALLLDARADAVQYVHDVRAEELAAARARECTLDNCGHMRQLDAIVDLLGMERGTRSVLDELRSRNTWEDKPDKWTDAIKAAHPVRSESHDEYGVAMKMVGNRHSKGALVELVNWLLGLLYETQPMLDHAEMQGKDPLAPSPAFVACVQNLRSRVAAALSTSTKHAEETALRGHVVDPEDDTEELIRFAREVFGDPSYDLAPGVRNLVGSLADRLEKTR